MTDADPFALCVFTEAAGEQFEGKVAVARVIHNRMAQRYESDGTIAGTVLKYDQFSMFYFDFVNGKYQRVCSTASQAAVRAIALRDHAQTSPGAWHDCGRALIYADPAHEFVGGPQWRKLAAEPRALMYCNLAISKPAWATPAAHIATIYHHDFFRA